MIRSILLSALVAAASFVQAQTAPAAAPAAAPVSPAKKDLVARVLKAQQPGIELVSRQLIEQPAAQMLQQAGMALQQRVSAERREAVGRDIQADVRKYVEEMGPQARDRATKLAPTTIGPILEEKFSEDELKQLIALLESPVNKKFQSLGAEMQKAFAEKLVAELRPAIEPKLRTLQQTIAGRLQPPASAPATGK